MEEEELTIKLIDSDQAKVLLGWAISKRNSVSTRRKDLVETIASSEEEKRESEKELIYYEDLIAQLNRIIKKSSESVGKG